MTLAYFHSGWSLPILLAPLTPLTVILDTRGSRHNPQHKAKYQHQTQSLSYLLFSLLCNIGNLDSGLSICKMWTLYWHVILDYLSQLICQMNSLWNLNQMALMCKLKGSLNYIQERTNYIFKFIWITFKWFLHILQVFGSSSKSELFVSKYAR